MVLHLDRLQLHLQIFDTDEIKLVRVKLSSLFSGIVIDEKKVSLVLTLAVDEDTMFASALSPQGPML